MVREFQRFSVMSLILRDIFHKFGDVSALAGASIEAAPGEILCLFGPSGCGKTTLLRVAAGLEHLQKGSVELDGAELAVPGRETPPEKRPIGFVFQDFVLFPHLTVEKNVAFGLAGGSGARDRVKAQLRAMDLEGLAKRYPHELSGGQQQRAALARALVREPRALLLDEPFASIDAAHRRRLREELRRMLKAQNVAVVMVTHDPEEALALGDRIALMRAGRVVESGAPASLFDDPQTPEAAAIFPGGETLDGAIRSGRLETRLGTFDAPGLADGSGVAVFRPGAIAAEASPEGRFVIDDSRFAGPGWALYVTPDGGAPVRVASSAEIPVGARVDLSIDPAGVFVFANQ